MTSKNARNNKSVSPCDSAFGDVTMYRQETVHLYTTIRALTGTAAGTVTRIFLKKLKRIETM